VRGMLLVVVAALLALAHPSGAQAVKARGISPEAMEQRIHARLFAGIELTSVQDMKVRAIIKKELADQMSLASTRPPGTDLWPLRVKLNQTRDSALAAVLTTQEQRTRFLANSEPDRLKPKN
jgi:hypothetical protein